MEKISIDAESNTKRKILSTLNANYDPLGIAQPALIDAKILLSKINDYSWDEHIDDHLLSEWKSICKKLNGLEFGINRTMGSLISEYEIIGFSDASKLSSGLLVFIHDLQTNKFNFI